MLDWRLLYSLDSPFKDWILESYAGTLADPDNGPAWGAMADLAWHTEGAGMDLQWAARAKQALLSNDAGAWVLLAGLYQRHGFLPEAMAAVRRALRLDTRCADAWLTYGHVLRRLGRARSARHAFRVAWRLDPGDCRV